uniref:Uncharacterized protein n=1 Tax=Trachysalambria curvirostris majanivirus TaxID=2984281 RepID=A0A9C7CFQ0_9VIRU|nr:MAG: hypothetical protein [Trachysalambria curvirostris majanivirus]
MSNINSDERDMLFGNLDDIDDDILNEYYIKKNVEEIDKIVNNTLSNIPTLKEERDNLGSMSKYETNKKKRSGEKVRDSTHKNKRKHNNSSRIEREYVESETIPEDNPGMIYKTINDMSHSKNNNENNMKERRHVINIFNHNMSDDEDSDNQVFNDENYITDNGRLNNDQFDMKEKTRNGNREDGAIPFRNKKSKNSTKNGNPMSENNLDRRPNDKKNNEDNISTINFSNNNSIIDSDKTLERDLVQSNHNMSDDEDSDNQTYNQVFNDDNYITDNGRLNNDQFDMKEKTRNGNREDGAIPFRNKKSKNSTKNGNPVSENNLDRRPNNKKNNEDNISTMSFSNKNSIIDSDKTLERDLVKSNKNMATVTENLRDNIVLSNHHKKRQHNAEDDDPILNNDDNNNICPKSKKRKVDDKTKLKHKSKYSTLIEEFYEKFNLDDDNAPRLLYESSQHITDKFTYKNNLFGKKREIKIDSNNAETVIKSRLNAIINLLKDYIMKEYFMTDEIINVDDVNGIKKYEESNAGEKKKKKSLNRSYNMAKGSANVKVVVQISKLLLKGLKNNTKRKNATTKTNPIREQLIEIMKDEEYNKDFFERISKSYIMPSSSITQLELDFSNILSVYLARVFPTAYMRLFNCYVRHFLKNNVAEDNYQIKGNRLVTPIQFNIMNPNKANMSNYEDNEKITNFIKDERNKHSLNRNRNITESYLCNNADRFMKIMNNMRIEMGLDVNYIKELLFPNVSFDVIFRHIVKNENNDDKYIKYKDVNIECYLSMRLT